MKRPSQEQAIPDNGGARWRAPHLGEGPNRQNPKQSNGNVSDYERAEGEKRRHAYIGGEGQQSSPKASESRAESVDGKAKQQSDQKHGQSGPQDGGIGIVPARDEPVAENPLAQKFINAFAAESPGKMRVVGVHPVRHKRENGQHLRQWRAAQGTAAVPGPQGSDRHRA